MDKDKDHLKIDLDFLDKKEPVRATPINKPESSAGQPPTSSAPVSSGYKFNLRNILIIGGIILFFGWAIFSGSSDSSSSSSSNSSSTSSTSSSDNVITGNYRCSQYNHDRATQLDPGTALGNSIDAKTDDLTREGDQLDSEKIDLENEYVNENSQYSIDQHNNKVDDYNYRLQSYQNRVNSHQNDIDAYNSKIQVYNNFLSSNCTKAY